MNEIATDRSEQIAAIELDLSDSSDFLSKYHSFGTEIAQASLEARSEATTELLKSRVRDARLAAEEEFRATAKQIEEQFGVCLGYERPWAYRPKPKAAYELWKRVVPMFIQQQETLNLKPGKLAAMLDASEPNFTITRDMMYDRLNPIAIKELNRLLKSFGISLVVKSPTTVRTLQKQLLARQLEAQGPADTFTGHFTICGDTVLVNGFPYQIQRNASGKPRVKIGGRHWLPLDAIRAFCTRND